MPILQGFPRSLYACWLYFGSISPMEYYFQSNIERLLQYSQKCRHHIFYTVKLGGKYFTAKVNTGDRVSAGDLLIEFDIDEIKKEFDIITPVLVANTDDFADVVPVITSGDIKVGEDIVKISNTK